jgi:hypothetical protein
VRADAGIRGWPTQPERDRPPRPADDPTANGSGTRAASLLDLDPGFGARLSLEGYEEARRRAAVRVVNFGRACSAKKEWHIPSSEGILLVLDGMLVRRTIVDDRCSVQLLGDGDPMHASDDAFSAFSRSRCQTLIPGRIALLDAGFLRRVAPWPVIACVLAERLARQGRILAALAMTSRMRRVDDRLRLLFAVLGERWGRVTPSGIQLRLPLSHELLGQLVGARRPPVTMALRALGAQGAIVPLGQGHWLLPRATQLANGLMGSTRPVGSSRAGLRAVAQLPGVGGTERERVTIHGHPSI